MLCPINSGMMDMPLKPLVSTTVARIRLPAAGEIKQPVLDSPLRHRLKSGQPRGRGLHAQQRHPQQRGWVHRRGRHPWRQVLSRADVRSNVRFIRTDLISDGGTHFSVAFISEREMANDNPFGTRLSPMS
jgi:hypothetical protein